MKSLIRKNFGKLGTKLPQALSVGEETFMLHMRARGLSPVREYRFCPDRNYRADFAFPDQKILIEIEGGTHSAGRHNRSAGYESDCEKYNLAAAMGFMVLRYTTAMVKNGIAELQVSKLIGVL